MNKNSDNLNKFLSLLDKRNLPQNTRRWYLRHVELYLKQSKTGEHSQNTMEQYLKFLGLNQRLTDWQYKQKVSALKLFFRDNLQHSWANQFPWDFWISSSDRLPNSHATIARDITPVVNSNKTQVQSTGDGIVVKFSVAFPEIYSKFVNALRVKYYSIRTEHSYIAWVARLVAFHSMKNPEQLTRHEVATYLEYLVVERKVASATQNQALCAIVFFFKIVLEKELGDLGKLSKSQKPKRLPVVLSKDEVRALLSKIQHKTYNLMANLLYGCGMRLMECIRLRIQDIDFSYTQITIRNTKGGKDRVVPLPKVTTDALKKQINFVKSIHTQDLQDGFGEVVGSEVPQCSKRV